MSLGRVVVISKSKGIEKAVRNVAREVFAADCTAEAVDIIRTVNPDLILFDSHLNPDNVSEFIETISRHTNAPVMLIRSDKKQTDTLTRIAQAKVCSHLNNAKNNTEIHSTPPRSRADNTMTRTEINNSEFFTEDFARTLSIVGRSKAMAKTLKMVRLVALSRCNPVLVVGETGTGKELAARAIHTIRHPNEDFVAVNCAALTANLLESELFGHVRGAFTGADREKTGLLEIAGQGTLFLDEISEMPLDLQAKLLRVLQEKTFRKVGGVKNINCHATIVATSNRNLLREVQANRFRRDLYYRLNISPVTIPPLGSRERREDIPLLAQYFLKTSTISPEKQNKITSLTKLALETLENYDWPGNVRELRNVIERAILLETTDKIGLSSIIIDSSECPETDDNIETNQFKNFSLAGAERELIARALKETGWQKTRAAALLGITRATLYAKVRQYNIERQSAGDDQTIPESLTVA